MYSLSNFAGFAMDVARTFWARISSSRLTAIYFAVALLTAGIQTGLQTRAFLVNRDASNLLDQIVLAAGLPDNEFTMWNANNTLSICNGLPSVPGQCKTVWASSGIVLSNGTSMMSASVTSSTTAVIHSTLDLSSSSTTSTSTHTQTVMPTSIPAAKNATLDTLSAVLAGGKPTSTSATKSGPSATASSSNKQSTNDDLDNEIFKVDIPFVPSLQPRADVVMVNSTAWRISNAPLAEFSQSVNNVTIDINCAQVLIWPLEMLMQTKRRDVFFIAFQIWVLGMSIFALFNESIPHTVAAFITHVFATAWTIFQVVETQAFRMNFDMITQDGACPGIDLLPDYWSQRSAVEIPQLALNCLALVLSVYLSWRLVKRFGWQTFKRIGASIQIHRQYRMLLTLSVSIQLSTFFLVAFLALWIDQLWNGSIAQYTHVKLAFQTVFILLIILVPVWLVAGWIALHREMRRLMSVFLAFAAIVGFLWGFMFFAKTFRLTFQTWMFFAAIASIALVLEVATLALGIACRLNFGKGLLEYLNRGDPDDGDQLDREQPDDTEKIPFPRASSLPAWDASLASPTSRSPTVSPRCLVTERRNDPDNMPYIPLARSISGHSTNSGHSSFLTVPRAAGAAPLSRSNTRSSTSSGASGRTNASRDRRRVILE